MRLKEQLDHLDHTFLKTVVTPFPDPLSAPEKAQVHAYLVLAHAVLEEHLESIFESHFDRLCSWLIADMVPLECVRFTFAVSELISKKAGAYATRDIPTMIRNLGKIEFANKLLANNGLKSSNVQKMARLVGLQWQDFENALNVELNDLDTLGAKRGAAGHLSPYTGKATEIANSDGPDDVRMWVSDGYDAVQAISGYLDDLLPVQQPNSLIVDWDGN